MGDRGGTPVMETALDWLVKNRREMRKRLYTDYGCEGKLMMVEAIPVWWVDQEILRLQNAENIAPAT